MASRQTQRDRYEEILRNLEQASRQHAATKSETRDWQHDRAGAIIEVSKLGVPRSTVAKLAGLTRGRVQQILDQAGEAGAAGEDWNDPELRQLVEAAIKNRPHPSTGVGLRRESTLGPHLGRGYGAAVRLSGELEKDRKGIVSVLEELLEGVRSGEFDELISLTEEERDVVQGNLIDI